MTLCIKINLTPELFGDTKYYFWCITENNAESSTNHGHGWASSINKAAEDAENYFTKILRNC